jgi:hypothetical protein
VYYALHNAEAHHAYRFGVTNDGRVIDFDSE